MTNEINSSMVLSYRYIATSLGSPTDTFAEPDKLSAQIRLTISSQVCQSPSCSYRNIFTSADTPSFHSSRIRLVEIPLFVSPPDTPITSRFNDQDGRTRSCDHRLHLAGDASCRHLLGRAMGCFAVCEGSGNQQIHRDGSTQGQTDPTAEGLALPLLHGIHGRMLDCWMEFAIPSRHTTGLGHSIVDVWISRES
jgi:hypothetical protein